MTQYLLGKIKPLWLREKIFWWFFFNKHSSYLSLFENAPLNFAPQASLKLMPTDVAHQMIALCGFYELSISRYISKIAKNGGLMIDVGANYGYHSCLWAAARMQNQVIAFEASPKNFLALRNNLIRNELEKQVNIYQLAIGKEKGELLFDVGPNDQSGWGGFSIHAQAGSIKVPVISLDEFFLQMNKIINVLKIDTEGADTWVLQGAKQLLRSHRIQHIFFEENVSRMSALGIRSGEAQHLLQSCGYRVRNLKGQEWYATCLTPRII